MLLKAFTIDVIELQVLIWENLGDLLRRMKKNEKSLCFQECYFLIMVITTGTAVSS